MDQLEPAFGGNNDTEFDMNKYAKRMREEDNKMHSLWTQANSPSSVSHNVPPSDSTGLEVDSDASNEKIIDSSVPKPGQYISVTRGDTNVMA